MPGFLAGSGSKVKSAVLVGLLGKEGNFGAMINKWRDTVMLEVYFCCFRIFGVALLTLCCMPLTGDVFLMGLDGVGAK